MESAEIDVIGKKAERKANSSTMKAKNAARFRNMARSEVLKLSQETTVQKEISSEERRKIRQETEVVG